MRPLAIVPRGHGLELRVEPTDDGGIRLVEVRFDDRRMEVSRSDGFVLGPSELIPVQIAVSRQSARCARPPRIDESAFPKNSSRKP